MKRKLSKSTVSKKMLERLVKILVRDCAKILAKDEKAIAEIVKVYMKE